jgi:diguanylate cyclase (GGDEF)-like protein
MASERQLSDVLSEFARTMVTDFSIEGILDRLVHRIVEMLPITAAGVTLISATTMPRYVAASNYAALRYEKLQTELGEGPCLAAYRTGQAVAVPDLRETEDFEVFGPRALEAGLVAVFTFPLRQGDKQLGALDLYRGTPGALDHDDMAVAQTLADVTAAYLVNADTRAELQESFERSYENSMHDALTGLPNRVLLMERMDHALVRGGRSKTVTAVLLADLDRFKAINDTYGHRAGDELLVAVAKRVTALLRPSDTIARLAGDEFVILCEDLESESHAVMIAQRIVDGLVRPFELSGVEVELSASVGVAFAGWGDQAPEQLLRDADIAMYQAKRKGGDRHQVIDLREQRLEQSRAGLLDDLREALRRGELRAEYQPIVATSDGRVTGVEALLRWDHPTRGSVAPDVLIPLAEQAGLIGDIGRWVLEQACTDLHRWDIDARFGVAVNVSARQLMEPGFAQMVAEVIGATGTKPGRLTLEITESVFIQDAPRALIVLEELKQLGLMLSLDDFGTGYSSLSYLDRFPVDVVKIDRGFVAGLTGNTATRAIVAAIVNLAHALNLRVVAEGVETVEEREQVEALGSEACQGYYFARPMPADTPGALMHQATDTDELRLPVSACPPSMKTSPA